MLERLLLVEDRENLRVVLARVLGVRFDVDAVGDGAEAIARLNEHAYAVVITDMRLPGAPGTEVLAVARGLDSPPEVIVVTGYAEVPAAVAALRAGAYDYLAKPVEPDDLLRLAVRAAERFRLVQRTRELQALVDERESGFIGRSSAALDVRRQIERAARIPAPVLLVGESGTGKQVAAREIHRLWTARSGAASASAPFVTLSSGSVSEAQLDAEFSAPLGTLFLDGVAELSGALQSRLMRLLEEEDSAMEARGPGSRRLIASSRRPLERAVSEGTFREDLYYRLRVVDIPFPSLRDRVEDIGLLAARFLYLASLRYGTPARRLTPEALAVLEAALWPGNVRELRHALEHAAVVADGDAVDVEHLPDGLRGAALAAPAGTYRAAVERGADAAGRDYLLALVRTAAGNVTRAAVEAGVERETLHRLLKKHGVDPARFRG